MLLNLDFNNQPEQFDNHVDNLRGTMFYVCQVRNIFIWRIISFDDKQMIVLKIVNNLKLKTLEYFLCFADNNIPWRIFSVEVTIFQHNSRAVVFVEQWITVEKWSIVMETWFQDTVNSSQRDRPVVMVKPVQEICWLPNWVSGYLVCWPCKWSSLSQQELLSSVFLGW